MGLCSKWHYGLPTLVRVTRGSYRNESSSTRSALFNCNFDLESFFFDINSLEVTSTGYFHPQCTRATTIMKISAAILALAVSSANAFAPSASVSRTVTSLYGAGNTDPVDRTMNGIDDNLGYEAFDPTAGDSPAVARNNHGGVWVQQRARPRRNRKSAGVRAMVRENIVTPANFIYPLFIHDEDFNTEIPSMPGCQRHSSESMLKEIGEALDLGVKAFVLFPKVADEKKTNLACEAYNPDGIVHRSIRMIKEKYPDAIVCTDVALDPYSDQGHDGVVEDGVILNDVTINQLCKQAVSQARAGADIVAPSDMQVS